MKITEKLLEDKFPLVEINDDCTISYKGVITFYFYLQLPEMYTAGGGEYSEMAEVIENALSSLKDEAIVSIYSWVELSKVSIQQFRDSQQKSFVEKEYISKFAERKSSQHRIYLTVGFPFDHYQSYLTGQGKTILSRVKKIITDLPWEGLEKHKDNCQRILKGMEAILNSTQLIKAEPIRSKTEIKDLVSAFMNLDQGRKGNHSLNPISSTQVGTKHYRCLSLNIQNSTVRTYLDQKSALDQNTLGQDLLISKSVHLPLSMMFPLNAGLPLNHINILTIRLKNINSSVEKAELIKKKAERRAKSDMEAERKFEELDSYLCDIAEGDRPVEFSHTTIVYSDTHGELDNKIALTQVAAAAANKNQLWEENLATMNLFFANIPGNSGDNFRLHTTTLKRAICFMPLEQTYGSDPYGIPLTDLQGKLVFKDLFSKTVMGRHLVDNMNMLCIGPSGSGKSNFMNKMAYLYAIAGHEILGCDVGGSFKIPVKQLGGRYLEWKENCPLEINPFAGRLDADKLDGLTAFILYISISEKGLKENDISKEKISIINKSISEYFKYTQERHIPGYYDFLDTFDSRLSENERLHLKIEDLKICLEPYVTGPFKNVFSRQSIDLSKDRIVFIDMESVKELKIFPVIQLQVILLLLQRVSQTTNIKHFFYDEGHKYMKGPMKDIIKYLIVTVRKHQGRVVFGTQSITDIMNTDVGVAMIGSCDRTILMKQKKEDIKMLRDVLELTDQQVQLVANIHNDGPYRSFVLKEQDTFKLFRSEESENLLNLFQADKDFKEIIEPMIEERQGHIPGALYQYAENIKNDQCRQE